MIFLEAWLVSHFILVSIKVDGLQNARIFNHLSLPFLHSHLFPERLSLLFFCSFQSFISPSLRLPLPCSNLFLQFPHQSLLRIDALPLIFLPFLPTNLINEPFGLQFIVSEHIISM